jgi:hypothetical protein
MNYMRYLFILLLGISMASCNTTSSKNARDEADQPENSAPNYEVAVQFINDYIDYGNDGKLKTGLLEWVNNRKDVTVSFKNELTRMLDEAEKEDPEMGLGFDPILDAQDNPDSFEVEKKDAEYLIVKGTNWQEFQVTLKLKNENDKWLVDGSGIINVPKAHRIKR